MPKQVQSFQTDRVPESKMILRVATVRAETANDETKSIEVVIASENPVERFDEERGEVIREILSMDGVRFRNDSGKLPIVDSHDRSTTRNVLGSIRNIRVDGTQLVGDATFARDEDSQNAYMKLKDGHLDDFSITATPHEIQNILRGEVGMFRDAEVAGPTDIVTEWQPTDASLVAVGADETSTQRGALLRSYDVTQIRKVSRMTDETRAALVGRGMDAGATDEEALEFAISKMADEVIENEEEVIESEDEVVIENADDEEEVIENADEETDEIVKAVDRALKSDHKRQREIKALCKSAGIKRAFADNLCKPGITLETAREKVLERMVQDNKALGQNGGTRISVGSEGGERLRDAMRDGMIARASIATGKRGRNPFATEFDANAKPAAGYEEFSKQTLLRMATSFLEGNKISTRQMGNKDIAMVAMGHQPTINRLRGAGIIQRDGDAWHTTGTFTNLLLDSINKELRDGYEEPNFTWDIWARQGTSVQDLKTINRIQFSEYPDLQDVAEGDPYPERKTSDAKESYAPQKKGGLFTITWETIVNDDLDAISRIPQMQGVAARRKQNKSVYGILTDNAAMADTGTLFNSTAVTTTGGHNNHITTGTVISEANLNIAYAQMMIQPNLGGEIAGVVPKYLIVPPGISATALQTVQSLTPPTVGGSAVGTSGTSNLYGPGGPRTLEVIVEPQLQAASATAWYLAADKSTIDTVELTFLAGEEAPVLESEWDMNTDVFTYKIRQTYGVKAIDWRGLFKNDGA